MAEILTTDELLAQIDTLIRNMAANGAKTPKKPKTTPEDRAARIAANDAECVKVFTEAGYKDVRPRVNVLTQRKWAAEGRTVRSGEKGLTVGPFTLFHYDQTDSLPTPTVEH